MTATKRMPLGGSGVEVTALGFGGATIGGLFRRLPEAQVQETLAAAFEAGIRRFDTAPLYGHGQSELRLGYQLRQRDLGDTVLATKVGRLLQRPRARPRDVDLGGWSGGLPFELRWDLSYDGILRSYEDSLQRFGLNRVDLLTIHDLDYSEHATPETADGYLDQLTREGGLRAAALQFALAHPAVATVIPGAVTPAEVRDNVAMVAWPIAGDLWLELKHEGLLRADAPTPER